eukprot:scaffold1220_cov259-Pinguiococcus_pyrenoidosus.AAC.128
MAQYYTFVAPRGVDQCNVNPSPPVPPPEAPDWQRPCGEKGAKLKSSRCAGGGLGQKDAFSFGPFPFPFPFLFPSASVLLFRFCPLLGYAEVP